MKRTRILLVDDHAMVCVGPQISLRTVRYPKYRIMEELGINTNSELVRYAVKHSITPLP